LRESKVEAHLKKLVKETGGVVRKVRWLGHRGAPDRWVGWPSTERTAWVELKKPATPHAACTTPVLRPDGGSVGHHRGGRCFRGKDDEMKLDVFKDREGRFRWSLVAANNRIVADSGQSFATRTGAWRSFQRIAFWLEDSQYIQTINRNLRQK
jgi:uncharacterized protein YegP (UPF0339 family)